MLNVEVFEIHEIGLKYRLDNDPWSYLLIHCLWRAMVSLLILQILIKALPLGVLFCIPKLRKRKHALREKISHV